MKFAPLLICLTALIALFFPVFGYYGYLDDFGFIHWLHEGIFFPWDNPVTAMGRPLTGFFIYFFIGQFPSVEHLVYVRLIGLLGVSICMTILYQIFRQQGLDPWVAIGFSFLVILSPGMVVWVGWASCATYSVGAVLGLLSGWLLVIQPVQPMLKLLRYPLSIVLMILALCFYQFSGFYVLLPLLASALCKQESRGLQRKVLWIGCFAVFMAMVGYFLVYRGIQITLTEVSDRGNFATDIVSKMQYFLNGPLKLLFLSWGSVWDSAGRSIVLFNLGFLLCLFVFLNFRRGMVYGMEVLLFWLGFMLISLLPLILVSENINFQRVLAPSHSVLYLGLLSSILMLPLVWQRTVLLLFALPVFASAFFLLRDGITRPAIAESQAMRFALTEMLEKLEQAPDYIAFVPPPLLGNARFSWPEGQELGFYSSALTWVTEPFVAVLLEESAKKRGLETSKREDREPFRVLHGSQSEADSIIRIDLFTSLSGKPSGVKTHDALGEVQLHGPDVWHHQWLGLLSAHRYPLLHHSYLGWLHFLEDKDGYLFFYLPEIGIIGMREDRFPEFVVVTSEEWTGWSPGTWLRMIPKFPQLGYRPPEFERVGSN